MSGHEVKSTDIGYFHSCSLEELALYNEIRISAQSLSENLIRSFDAVVHLAGISNDPVKQMSESSLYDPAVGYSKRLAEFCAAENIKFIFASSCSVYGKQTSTVDEMAETNPQTPYSKNKLEIEECLLNLKTENWILSL